jgi:peptidoglycan/LPS O-acetylase OafA/YrhL
MLSAGFLAPAFAAIIFGLALRPRWIGLLEGRFLVLLGEASYSLYLLHSIVITMTFNLFPRWPAGLRAAFAVTLAVVAALLCFSLVEQPARRLLRPAAGSKPLQQPADQPQVGSGDERKQTPGNPLHRY